MAIFRQKGRKTWQVRLWVPERGRQVSWSARTEDEGEARKIEKQMRLALSLRQDKVRFERLLSAICGPEARAERPGMALGEAWQRYLGLAEVRLSAREVASRKAHWARWLAWLARHQPGVKLLHEVSPMMAAGWVDALRADGLSPKTANNLRASVAVVFARLLVRAGMTANPFEHVAPLPKGETAHGRAFTDAEIGALLAAAKGQEWEGAILVGLYTGQRYGDVARLRWDALVDVPGGPDGEALRCWSLTPSKTARHGIRGLVPLHGKVLAWLDGQPRAGEYVFPRLARKYLGEGGRSDFGKLLDAAGINRAGHVTFHCLRHTWASRMSAAGASQELLMRGGGWRQVATADMYNHDVATLAAAVRRMG